MQTPNYACDIWQPFSPCCSWRTARPNLRRDVIPRWHRPRWHRRPSAGGPGCDARPTWPRHFNDDSNWNNAKRVKLQYNLWWHIDKVCLPIEKSCTEQISLLKWRLRAYLFRVRHSCYTKGGRLRSKIKQLGRLSWYGFNGQTMFCPKHVWSLCFRMQSYTSINKRYSLFHLVYLL
jgi:hypothetical protein